MTDWFTSDWHFFHPVIIDYCKRPFSNEREMRDTIIERYNEVVGKNDHVYVLGDVAMIGRHGLAKLKPLLDKMKGIKHLILGNHDEGKPFTYERVGFTTVHTALQYNEDVILRHDPAACNVMPDKLWLVGHVHNLYHYTTTPIKSFNVGVDVNDFRPVNLAQIKHTLANTPDAGTSNPYDNPPPCPRCDKADRLCKADISKDPKGDGFDYRRWYCETCGYISHQHVVGETNGT